LDRFKQFLWRPRPRTLLTKEQQRLIRKNLREYSRQFEEEDAADETTIGAELIALRKRLVDEWNAWRERCRRELTEEMTARGKRVKFGRVEDKEEDEDDKEEIEVWIDELIDQVEEEVLE
jgi:translation initiation factor 3 subunit B